MLSREAPFESPVTYTQTQIRCTDYRRYPDHQPERHLGRGTLRTRAPNPTSREAHSLALPRISR
jgi:hypothetical protein